MKGDELLVAEVKSVYEDELKLKEKEDIETLQRLLRQLFQLQTDDQLNYGIYRIMNEKRAEVEKFITKTLPDQVRDACTDLPSENTSQHRSFIFSHIHSFFSRYYEKGDFMPLRRYSVQQKYAIPYNGEEVLLHWANKDQYYIKTGEFFSNSAFRIGDYTIRFRTVQAETAQDNVKAADRYFLLADPEAGEEYDAEQKELTIGLVYRALSDDEKNQYGKQETEKIKKESQDREKKQHPRVDQKKLNLAIIQKVLDSLTDSSLKEALSPKKDDEGGLARHLATYTHKSTTDFFIHKDLGGFLTHELDFYIKNEVFHLDDLGSGTEVPIQVYVSRARIIKKIGEEIIAFLAQIEEFQKRLFEKKKFVIGCNYCLTLDKVPQEFWPEILENKEQITEWEKLYGLESEEQQSLFTGYDIEFLMAHPFLMIDTKFFDEGFTDRLLGAFQDLDAATGGLMIKSENFQALNLLQDRYRESVKCAYIDPPYNTGNDGFLYKDRYQHSSWLSMMYDRMNITLPFFYENSSFYCQLDYNESSRLKLLLDELLSFEREIIWSNESSSGFKAQANNWIRGHDSILFYSKSGNPDFSKQYLELAESTKKRYDKTDPITGEKYKEYFDDDGTIRKVYLSQSKGKPVSTVWTDIISFQTVNASREHIGFDTQKPVNLLKRIINASNVESGQNVLDFFAGSGTIAHATLSLNKEDKIERKYILIEMAYYFDEVLKPRIKKICYSSNWKNGSPEDLDGQSHIFKYLSLESYEDSLNNISFDTSVQKTLMDLEGYFLNYVLDFETRDSPCRLTVENLKHPFEYQLKVIRDNSEQTVKVDLPETFAYLIGLQVRIRRAFSNPDIGRYLVYHGTTREGTVTVIWRNCEKIDLTKDKDFVMKTILTALPKADTLYLNGEFLIPGAHGLDRVFKERMGA